MYGPTGPSEEEETRESMPPERFLALLQDEGDGETYQPSPAYDSWSIGVFILELVSLHH